MKGRIADKIKYEKKIQDKVKDLPDYMIDYYYYLNERTHMTKLRYINNVIRFLTWYGNGNIDSVDIMKLNKISARVIQSYMANVQYIDDEKEIGSDAKANIYSSINSFMIFLKRNDLIEDNPFEGGRISRPKAHDNEITFLEPEEYAMIKRGIMKGVGNARAVGKQKKWMYN